MNDKSPNKSMMKRLEAKIKKIPMIDKALDQYMENFATEAQKKLGKEELKKRMKFFSKGGSVKKKNKMLTTKGWGASRKT
jgi:adenine/guanine phosphoribosyltransferase-like PRPP-binding protein